MVQYIPLTYSASCATILGMRRIPMMCANCGERFLKPWDDAKKALRKGRIEFFCSRSCASKSRNEGERLSKYSNNRKGTCDAHGYYLAKIRTRCKKKGIDYDVDRDYIRDLWKSQKGLCKYTGIPLILQNSSGLSVRQFELASLDRIDNSKGYIRGNLQFVSVSCNYAKGTMTDKEFLEFMEIVQNAKHRFSGGTDNTG